MKTGEPKPGMRFLTLGPFFVIAFGLTWGIAALLILFTDQIEAIFGELSYTNPLFILAVYAPGIAGVFLVWRHYGPNGLAGFLRRLSLWRMPLGWWMFLVAGIPAVFYLGAILTGAITDPFPFSPWYEVYPPWRSRCSSAPSRSSDGEAWHYLCCSDDTHRPGQA